MLSLQTSLEAVLTGVQSVMPVSPKKLVRWGSVDVQLFASVSQAIAMKPSDTFTLLCLGSSKTDVTVDNIEKLAPANSLVLIAPFVNCKVHPRKPSDLQIIKLKSSLFPHGGSSGILSSNPFAEKYLEIPKSDQVCYQIALWLIEEAIRDGNPVNFFAESLANGLASHIASSYKASKEGAEESPLSNNLWMVEVIVREHIGEDIEIDKLAKRAGMTIRRMRELIKNTTGLTPYRFVQRIKLDYAKELLVNTDLSILAISSIVGYSEQSSFGQMFQKLSGLSPMEYRRQVRGMHMQ